MAGKFLGEFWQFLNQKIEEIPWDKLTTKGVDALQTVDEFKAAWKVHAPNIARLEPYLDRARPLVQLLDSPATQLVLSGLPLLSVGIDLLKLYLGVVDIDPTFENSVLAAAQLSYLESLRQILAGQNDLQALLATLSLASIFEQQMTALDSLGLSRSEAKLTLSQFRHSRVAASLNRLLADQLLNAGICSQQVPILVERVAWGTPRYLHSAIADLKATVKPLADYLQIHGLHSQEKYEGIEAYLGQHIAPLPHQLIFDEADLRLADLYVELDVQPLDSDGNPLPGQTGAAVPLNSHQWARTLLETPTDSRKVMLVQAEAGRGKSVFCQMLASWVSQELYPAFIPILVCLREVRALESNLSQTLTTLLQYADFVQSDGGWLTDVNLRFLLIFDGFDELLLERRSSGGLKDFLQQVSDFQRRSPHQCLITGRPLALQGLEWQMPQAQTIERVRLEPLSDVQRDRWLGRWAQYLGDPEATAFRDFLAACPVDIGDSLAREPLLLYLLGRLHREGHLQASMFTGKKMTEAKIRVYDESIRWVLEKQRQAENVRLVGLDAEDLREVLREAALCVTQSGHETAPLAMLKNRLTEASNPVTQLFEQARGKTGQNTAKILNNLLTTFYIRAGKGDHAGSFEFAHKSFVEFLFAERLKQSLEDWTRYFDYRQRKRYLSDAQVDWQIYDLLGFGALTPGVMEYLTTMLFTLPTAQLIELFEQLYRFYSNWSEGLYLDREPGENLPQRKMLQLQAMDVCLGLRQIDIYTGLNVMILLFEFHHYGQTCPDLRDTVVFRPAKANKLVSGDSQKLRRIIGYSECVKSSTFTEVVGFALSGADLSQADLNSTHLVHADLSYADLSSTELISAYLSGADLSGANLSGANLTNAELFSANLAAANLTQAKLPSAKLFSANLTQARLIRAELFSANLSRATLSGADLCGANLTNAELRKANLVQANLTDAVLLRANLTGAQLTGANLSHANLSGAVLCGAHLNGANLRGVDLSEADLRGVRWDRDTNWAGVRGLNRAKHLSRTLRQHLKAQVDLEQAG
jgi:uncharacterized protein YjbI with pentapeptide repeats